MQIFEERKKILTNTGLGTEQFLRIAKRNVPRLCIRGGIICVLVLCIIPESMICINNFETNLTASLWALCLIIIYLSALIIFICLIIKTIDIKELFDYLEKDNELLI